MNKLQMMVIGFAAGIVCLVNASNTDINLSGTVKDQDGKPIPGVVVYLDKNDPFDTTGADGRYLLTGVGVSQAMQRRNVAHPVLSGNAISFKVGMSATAVRLDMLDLSGRCVKNVMDGPADARTYNVQLPLKCLAPSMYIVSLRIGNEHFTQRVLLQENGMFQPGNNSLAAQSTVRQTASGGLTDEIDIMHFVKAHFAQVDTSIYSYSGVFNVIMNAEDTIPPVVTLLPPGSDTVYFAFQDSIHYMKFWDPDNIPSYLHYEDNSGQAFLRPSTNTLMEKEHSSFAVIKYQVDDLAGKSTVKYRLLVLYDSTVKNDVTPPNLTVGSDTVKFTKGDIFSFMQGVSAVDAVDSLISFASFIKVTDNVQSVQERTAREIYMDVVGTYTITYQVMDTHKNLATRKRTLIVSE
jgi:hypothetical protein